MTVVEDQSAIEALLEQPDTWEPLAGPVDRVERIETHAAVVFLAGDRVLKLKRAVDYPYMDLADAARRGRACRAEVALNRRTAPSIYRGIRPVLRDGAGGARLGDLIEDPDPDRPPEGPEADAAVDWVVEMRRFDRDAMLDSLAEAGRLDAATVERLAEGVAGFHARAAARPDFPADAFARVVEENLEELRADPELFDPDVVARLEARSRAELDLHAPLIATRTRDGFVRHCHGDLHLRNIVMLDGVPTPFDAIEFDDALATVDVLYDLAFLLMDLDHRGLRALGNRVFNRYLEITGDDEGLALLPLFLSARASVRAKVAASAAAAIEDEDACAEQRRAARDYLSLAAGYMEPAPARLVAVGGLSGTGKTTAARGLAPDLGRAPGALILRSDVARKRAAGVLETEALPAGAYSESATAAVYGSLVTRAQRALAAGHAVIADAVYAERAERLAIGEVAGRIGVRFDGIWLEAGRDRLVARVSARSGDASDADAAIVDRQLGYDLGPLDWTRIDASGGLEDTVSAIRGALAGAGRGAAARAPSRPAASPVDASQ
ncbi:MAG: AAA family ATPase [Azospirillaceae bacterium]